MKRNYLGLGHNKKLGSQMVNDCSSYHTPHAIWTSKQTFGSPNRLTISLWTRLPDGLVVRIRRSHRRGPGSIPGQGTDLRSLCHQLLTNVNM